MSKRPGATVVNARERARHLAADDVAEMRARLAARETGQPRPPWLENPALLPKHPPGWKAKGEP